MNHASMFYSQSSRMSSYPTYERTQVKQKGGFISVNPMNPFSLLTAALFSGVKALAKVNRNFKQYSEKPIISATVAVGRKGRTK